MLDRLWYRPWDILGRLAIAILAAAFVWEKLPIAHTLPSLLGLVQLGLYLTLLMYPPRLRAILLCDQIEDKAQAINGATLVLAVPATEVGQHHITVKAAEVSGAPVDKYVKIGFARDLAAARIRRIHDSFLISFVPMVMVVALTFILAVLQQAIIAGHASDARVDFVIPFLQGLIGLIPFVWIIGQLLGEVTCHRDTVFKALS